MANYKADERIVRQMTDEDKAALLSIYQHRCLDERLLCKYIYSSVDSSTGYAAEHINQLIAFRLLDSVDYGLEYPALFLTTLGIETVKATSRSELQKLYSFEYGKAFLPLSSELKMHPKIINHQMHLNSFVLEFESYAKQIGYFRYFDEKFMPPASNFMMPDAMAELDDYYVFFEMDMGTEAGSRLAQKWNSYRTFLNAPGPFYREKPVVMLFIIDGVKNVEVRRRNIASRLMTYLADRVNGQFEVYIDGVERLHSVVKSQLLKQMTPEDFGCDTVCRAIYDMHNFLISKPQFLSQMDISYGYYIRQLTESKKIQVIGGRPQEFLMDVWLDGRLSVLRSLLYYQRALGQIVKYSHREIPYIIVVPSEKWACTMLKMANTALPEGVFFTTPSRLSSRPWAAALFCIDQLWNVAHFTDGSLIKTIHERRMARLS